MKSLILILVKWITEHCSQRPVCASSLRHFLYFDKLPQ